MVMSGKKEVSAAQSFLSFCVVVEGTQKFFISLRENSQDSGIKQWWAQGRNWVEPETQSWLPSPTGGWLGGTQGPDHCPWMSVADAHGISRVRETATLTSVVPRQGSRGQLGFRRIPSNLPSPISHVTVIMEIHLLHTPSYYPGDEQEEAGNQSNRS